MSDLSPLPVALLLAGRDVLVVGAGPVAAGKIESLLEAGARVRVVSPARCLALDGAPVRYVARGFEPSDVDGAWLVVSAATSEVNQRVAAACEARRVFVISVDDPASCSAFSMAVVRRGPVTVAIGTGGKAPALSKLLRRWLDASLPRELGAWAEWAEGERARWKREGTTLTARTRELATALARFAEAKEGEAA